MGRTDLATISYMLNIRPGLRVLEAGTGAGALSMYLSSLRECHWGECVRVGPLIRAQSASRAGFTRLMFVRNIHETRKSQLRPGAADAATFRPTET
jgi:tRNA A58 N-methylase Trm61